MGCPLGAGRGRSTSQPQGRFTRMENYLGRDMTLTYYVIRLREKEDDRRRRKHKASGLLLEEP